MRIEEVSSKTVDGKDSILTTGVLELSREKEKFLHLLYDVIKDKYEELGWLEVSHVVGCALSTVLVNCVVEQNNKAPEGMVLQVDPFLDSFFIALKSDVNEKLEMVNGN